MFFEVFLGLLTILFLIYVVWFKRPKNYPPGPWRLPVLGNLLSIGNAPFRTFIKWKPIYGPVVAVDFGSFPAVAVSDYKLVKEILNDPISTGRPDLQPFLDRSGGVRRGILFSDGEEWNEQRRFTLRHLKEFGFGKKSSGPTVSTESIIRSEISEWIHEFQKNAGESMCFKFKFHSAILNVLWTLMAGERLQQDHPGVAKLMLQVTDNVETHNGQAALAMFIPWLTKLFPKLSGYEKMMADLQPVLDFLQSYIDKHRESIIPEDPRDLIDAYINKINSTTDSSSSFYGKIGDRSLLTVMLDLFFAGTESTSNTMNWTFLYLATNPHVQQSLHEEIDIVIGNSRDSTLADRPQMPYTEALINEVIRISSIAPIGLFHKTLDELAVGEYRIPKDTMLILNLYDCHMDPEYWGDPEAFRPERFLSEDKTKLVKHEAFLGFSAGKRVCIGETLARDELFLFITSIFQKFHIRVDPENPNPSTEPIVSFLLSTQPHKLILDWRENVEETPTSNQNELTE